MCCQRRARANWVYETAERVRSGFVGDMGDDDSGALSPLNATLRRFPNVPSSRGGVLMGELRRRCSYCGSSSKCRPSTERPEDGWLMETGCGGREVDALLGVVDPFPVLEDDGADDIKDPAGDEGCAETVVADAVAATVSGLLRLFFNVLSRRSGLRKARDVYALESEGDGLVVPTVEVDLVVATERMDD